MLARPLEDLARRIGLEGQEGPRLALMGGLVGTLFCGYTIAKVLRDALFLEEFGALALPYAYVGVALSSLLFVWVETAMARRFSRGEASRLSQIIAIVISLLAAIVLPLERHWTTAWFYLWTGSQAMMLMPHFWLLALDVWDSRRARRVFPILAGFGLLGGIAGGAIAAWSVRIGPENLMWMLSSFLMLAYVLSRFAEAHRVRRAPEREEVPSSRSNWEIVRRSTYIQVLIASLALSVIIATLVDFQFKNYIQNAYRSPADLTHFLGTFYVGLNVLSLLVQFGVAGWVMERLHLGAASSVQPAVIMVFSTISAFSSGGWAVVAMRWIQGVLSQSLGKSSNEIYYAAIRQSERRQVKPAIDTLVERWSDAAVGVILILTLHFIGVAMTTIALGTALLSALWLGILVVLYHQYGRAFRSALSTRWSEFNEVPESLRTPLARQALLEALATDDSRRLVIALKLSEQTRDPSIARAVERGLSHPLPAVRAASVAAMEAMRLRDRDGAIERLLKDEDENVRRAAVSHLMATSRRPAPFARRLLEGDDPALRRDVVDVLFERPHQAPGVLTLAWIDHLVASPSRDDLVLAARALGALAGREAAARLLRLLSHGDAEVRRAALTSARRRPSPMFLDVLLPYLLIPELSHEARLAIAAIGGAAVPALRPWLEGRLGNQAQDMAVIVLARIPHRRAVRELIMLARSSPPRPRHLGLRSLMRLRLRTGDTLASPHVAHRLFLREVNDYRAWLVPGLGLERHEAPEVRLLGESFIECAQSALERAVWALTLCYEPRPLFGALGRLMSRETGEAAPALEYLGHLLPRGVFLPFSRIFEAQLTQEAPTTPDTESIAAWIRSAWESDDPWLRACAVRAARRIVPFDLTLFESGDGGDPRVRAELEDLLGAPRAVAC